MKIKLLKNVAIGQEEFPEGTILEKPDPGIAASLLGTGWAVEVIETKEQQKSQEIKINGSKNGSSGN